MRNLAVLFILLQVVTAHASSNSEALRARFRGRIAGVQAILAKQNTEFKKTGSDNECLRRYDRFYNDTELNIAIGLGYYDGRPSDVVYDIDLETEISKMLLTPCNGQQDVCGFQREKLDLQALVTFTKVFVKTVKGPDQKPVKLRIKLFHSSENPDDDENRKDANQYLRSNQVAADFKTALRSSDVVFYMGHSRDGGGPDFDPPRLNSEGHVDYTWYRRHRLDFQTLLTEIGSTSTPPKLLALLSCYSNMHFAGSIRKTSPRTGLLVSLNEIGDGQMFEGLLTVINGIQRFKCDSQLAQDLDAVNLDKTKVAGKQKSLLEFRNFPQR